MVQQFENDQIIDANALVLSLAALAEKLGVAPTTGSLHLKALAHADLVALSFSLIP